MSIEVAQIFLLDDNLHILFGQERVNLKSVRLADIRQLISEALHNKSYSHLIPIEDGFTIAFKNLVAFPEILLVLIGRTENKPKSLILLNAQLEDCDQTISSFYSIIPPDWLNEIPKVKTELASYINFCSYMKYLMNWCYFK